MAEQSYVFDFSRVPSFFEHFNIDFHISDMDGSSAKFQLVLAEYGGNNIDEYLDESGCLDTDIVSVDTILVEDCKLSCTFDDYGDATIKLAENVTFDIQDTLGDVNIPLKAVFLRDKTTGYVMGYSINIVSFNVTNAVVFDDDVIFWSTGRLNCNG